jgi:hypothetical protein
MGSHQENSTNKKISEIHDLPKPKRGPGRPKGAWSYSHREVRELAQSYGPEAIGTLIKIMRTGESEQVKVAAAKELLVRGFGNSVTVSGPNDGPIPVTYEGLTSTIQSLVSDILGQEVVEAALKTERVQ